MKEAKAVRLSEPRINQPALEGELIRSFITAIIIMMCPLISIHVFKGLFTVYSPGV